MSLRFASSGSGNGGGAVTHDMIRFTPDDANLVAGSMSPLRLGDQSSPGGGNYGVVPASEHTQLSGSLCRHRARRDPSAWLDDPTACPYATYYCSCRRETRPRLIRTSADDDDAPAGRDVVVPPDVAAAPPLYASSTTLGVSHAPTCGHVRQHVVVCTAAGGGAAEKIYQERYGYASSSTYKYSTFLGTQQHDSHQSRALCVALDSGGGSGGGSHVVDHHPINAAPAAAAAADNDDLLTLSSSAAEHHLAGSAPVNL